MIRILASLLLSMFIAQTPVYAKFEEYKTYIDVAPEIPAQGLPRKVIGFFWYGCVHCYPFEETLQKWLDDKPDDIEFNRMAAVLSRGWIPHARAFYAAEKMGILDKTHKRLFDAIHKDGKRLHNTEELADFLAQASGKDSDQILQMMNSPEIHEAVGDAIQTGHRYRLRGVPSMLVGGKYLIFPGAVGEQFGELIEFLLDQ